MTRDIVVIGASAGGVPTLQELLAGLPERLPAAVFVVLHLSPTSLGILPQVLAQRSRLPALHPRDGVPARHGIIHVAPPDRHLLVEGDLVRITHGPRENRCRPAIDPLFRSAAESGGTRTIGVILSGTLADGSAGLRAVQQHGGVTVVQNPEDALWPEMPCNALKAGPVDHCLPVSDMPALLTRLVTEKAAGDIPAIVPLGAKPTAGSDQEQAAAVAADDPQILVCPECGGALREGGGGALRRYRCHVGHAFSGEVLASTQLDAIEAALWTALRTHKERAALCQRLAEDARRSGYPAAAAEWEREIRAAERHMDILRKVLEEGSPLGILTPDA